MAGALDPDDGGQQLLLGKMLLERGLITPDQLREALVERARTLSDGNAQPSPLGGILVRKGYLSDDQLLSLIAEQQSGDVAPPYVPPPEPAPGSAPVLSAPSLPPMTAPDPLVDGGGQLGKYRLVGELGRGGMGVVYEAIDTQLNRKVALKLMLSNPNADPKERALEEERFIQEAQLSAKLKHPHIVTVYEAGLLDGRQFLAMEMIDGQSFSDWRKTVTMRDQIEVLADVCNAVHHAHEQGILHRDLKPRNILVSGSGHSYVTDFGLAKSLGKNVHQSLTGSGAVVGTPAYMSPEQAQGMDRIDWRTDIYSLGVILYECMTGRTPFTGESPIEILMKVVKDPVVPPLQIVDAGSALGLDKGIENICLKALAKKDRDRYVTAQALSDDLRKWLSGEKVQVAAPRGRSKGGKRVYALVVVVLLLALAGALGYMGIITSRASVKGELELAARLMAEENYSEAMIQYRVAMAKDPSSMEAAQGAKAAQEGMNKKDREREDRFRSDVINKFKEAEEALLRARELERKQREAKTEEERQQFAEEAARAEMEAKKLSEAAARAEESFRRTQSLVVVPPGAPVDVWKDAINLMPIVDARRNAVWGTWDLQEGGRLVSDRSPHARLEIPFQLPQEYDFRMVFERRTGAGGVSVVLSRGGHQFRCEMGGESNTRFAFETSKPAGVETPESKTEALCLRNDVAYTVMIQVRANGAKMFLNGKPVLSWETDYTDIGLNPLWKLRNTLRLGIGSHESETIFHRLELLEVTGKGRRQEQQGSPVLKALDVVPAQLRPGLVAEYFHGTGFQSLALRRIDPSIDFRWKESSPWAGGPTDSFSIRWTGYLHTPRTMRYFFSVAADDGVRMWVGDQQVLASWTAGRTDAPRTFDCTLTEGYHKVTIEYYELAYLASIVLGWSTSPTNPPIPITAKSFFHSAADDRPVLSSKVPQLLGSMPGSTQNVTAVAVHPGGRLLAVAGEDRRIRLFDPLTQRDLNLSAVHPAGVLCVAFSADGTQFATGTRERDNRVRVWDAAHRTEMRSFEGPTASVQCVAYSPNGKLLAAGSYDRSIRVWAVDSQDDPVVLNGHLGAVEAVAFTPDGKRLVSASLDHTIRLWDVEKGKEVYLVEAHADYVSSLAFSPGGRTLASGGWDGLIKLWDVDPEADPPMSEIKVLPGGGIEVVCLAFSSDGMRLAAGGNDGVIRVWDPAEGREVKVLPGHTARVSGLAFAPSGRFLISGSADTSVRFWNTDR